MGTDYTLPKAIDLKNLTKKAKEALDIALGLHPEHWVVQPKYDGCALIVQISLPQGYRGHDLVVDIVSAAGKPIKSCDHIADVCLDRCGPGVYVFEMWHPTKPFQEISGDFRRHTQCDLVPVLLDGYMAGDMTRPYEERYTRIWDLASREFRRLPSSNFLGMKDAWGQADEYKAMGGYDGVILRNVTIPFVAGRSKADIIKLKPLIEFDLEVVGFNFAVGEKTGKNTGALLCRWKGGTRQLVSTGMTQAQIEEGNAWIGRIVQVRAMGLTEDGFLREPRFVGERTDKLSPDF